MSCYAALSIPQINYGSYISPRPYYPAPDHHGPVYTSAYSALPKPPVGTVLYERVYDDDLATVKAALHKLLKQNKLRNMPAGFPFHVANQNFADDSVMRLSHAPYEFKEYFVTSDNRSRSQCATFSYSPSRSGMMSWQISVPGRQSSQCRDAPSEFFYFKTEHPVLCCSNASPPLLIGSKTLAQVQVHPMALETTSFGLDFMIRPEIMLQALAASLEAGKMITIQIANNKTRIFCRKRNIFYSSGEILFVSTDQYGQHEIAFVFQP